MNTNYKHSSRAISDFVAGTINSTINGYTSFPGTNVLADVSGNYDTLMIRPLNFSYQHDSVDLNLSRFAKYQDFTYTTNLAEQAISTNAPTGTTHISGVLIGGGAGGGAGGGGNNPDVGSDTAGAAGGGGGSGAQLFFYKLAYASTLKVIIGGGGGGGTCAYKTLAIAGTAGNVSKIKYSGGVDIYSANSGNGGNGGASGNANTDGGTVGTGGSSGNAVGTPLHNPTPGISATTNTGVGGASGNVWNGTVANGGSGGSLNKLLNTANYGNGGAGGTVNGRGSGATSNDSNGASGNNGFCRIYYLIE